MEGEADDCVLFLWVTFPLLKEGLGTMRQFANITQRKEE